MRPLRTHGSESYRVLPQGALLLLALLLLVSNSCTTAFKAEERLTNFIKACDTKEALAGFTKQEIIKRFGQPDFKKTTYVYDNRKDIWYYINMYGKMSITFVNGVAMGVEYD